MLAKPLYIFPVYRVCNIYSDRRNMSDGGCEGGADW